MQVTISQMSQPEAEEIAAWHYEEPHTFYDFDQDPDDLAELLNPECREGTLFSARDSDSQLIGFFAFNQEPGALDLGLGLHPRLTGQGIGLHFIQSGLRFARSRFRPDVIQLSVAAFNARAISVYERAGFRDIERFQNKTNGGEFAFVRMQLQEFH